MHLGNSGRFWSLRHNTQMHRNSSLMNEITSVDIKLRFIVYAMQHLEIAVLSCSLTYCPPEKKMILLIHSYFVGSGHFVEEKN
jgi:hypothetical protein